MSSLFQTDKTKIFWGEDSCVRKTLDKYVSTLFGFEMPTVAWSPEALTD